MAKNNPAGKSVAVFGGSRVARDSVRYQEAYHVGALLAQAGFTLINGGYAGTMEASAKGAREAGGRVLGVTSTLFTQNVMNDFIDEEIPTDDLYNRIRELVVRGDGYIVLRGNIGTLAELQMVWNVASLEPGFNRPIILLGEAWRNVIGCYQENLGIGEEQTRYLQFAATPEECIILLRRAFDSTSSPESAHPLPPAPSP